jgi:GxxExxY protein
MQMAIPIRHQDVDPALNELATRVIGVGIEVHRPMGPGFSESAYEEAFCVELALQGIPYRRQVRINLSYKGRIVGEGIIDLLIDEKLVVELKAVAQLAPVHEAQLVAYLKMTGLQIGLLMNFNAAVLKDGLKRVVVAPSKTSAPPSLRSSAMKTP